MKCNPFKKSLFIIVGPILLLISSCTQSSQTYDDIDWQGHRGARGEYPENTWAAFKYAIDNNMNTLEMDVVISEDKKVILSHEPFLNHKICLDSSGNKIAEKEEKNWNLYEMSYSEIKKCDCGNLRNTDFPHQELVSSPKPLLLDIIQQSIEYCETKGKDLPYMNVEIKYEAEGKNKYHPNIEEYSKQVYEVLNGNYPQDKWNIQSFDFDVLKHFHSVYPTVPLAALVDESGAWKKQFRELGFVPEMYSPNFHLVDQKMVTDLHKQGVKIIPWTVNEKKDANRLLKIGVDGIITDYPKLANKFRNNP